MELASCHVSSIESPHARQAPSPYVEVVVGLTVDIDCVVFRVTQVIESANAVYLEHQQAGRWAGWDRRGDLSALRAVLSRRRA